MNVDEKVDTTGMVCPMPAVETRKAMRKLESGKTIEVIGDFMEAVDNVARMIKKQGGEVIEKESAPNHFKVIGKKL